MASMTLVILLSILVIGGIAVGFFLWALNSGKFHQQTLEAESDTPATLATAANEAVDSGSDSARGAA